MNEKPGPSEPKEAGRPRDHRQVYRAALVALRRLRSEHRVYYRADFDGFRDAVRRACSQAFRKKPGPKPKVDLRIRNAARKRARRAEWPELYPDGIDGHGTL